MELNEEQIFAVLALFYYEHQTLNNIYKHFGSKIPKYELRNIINFPNNVQYKIIQNSKIKY
jgi:hypothetical protein